MTPSRSIFPVLFALFFVSVFVWQLGEAFFGYGQSIRQAALFPVSIGIPFLGLALIALAIEIRHWVNGKRQATEQPSPADLIVAQRVRRRTATIIAWIIGSYLAIWLLGFIVVAPLVTFLYVKLAGKERWLMAVILAVIVWLFFDGLFQCALHLPLMERLPGELFIRLEDLVGVQFNQYFLVPFLC